MKLMTKEIEKMLPALYATEETQPELADKKIIVKFFTPWTNWTWFVFEGEKRADGDFEFFGMVHGQEKEAGYFTLNQLAEVRGPGGLKIERDCHLDAGITYGEYCKKQGF